MTNPLMQGCSGADVQQAQQALNRAGRSVLPALAVDGIFGSKTHARVVEFQKSRGLKPDGIIGPKTRAALGMPAAAPGVRPQPGANVPPGGEKVVSTVVAAATAAMTTWKRSAVLTGVAIHSVTAIGGQLIGPPLGVQSSAQITALSGDDRAIAIAAARAIDQGFQIWQGSVRVPGLPWYPAFAAFPGPVAAPTPNTPTPLIALSVNRVSMSAGALNAAMRANAGSVLAGKAGNTFEQIAKLVSGHFDAFLVGSIVTSVMGTGPVPTFAPPTVPVGPVVGGIGNSMPGGIH